MAFFEADDFPDEYREVMNEINDFIAVLDDVPDDSKTSFLLTAGTALNQAVRPVVDSQIQTFGVSSNDPSATLDYNGTRNSNDKFSTVRCDNACVGGNSGDSVSSDVGYGGSSSATEQEFTLKWQHLSRQSNGCNFEPADLSISPLICQSFEHHYEPIDSVVLEVSNCWPAPPTPARNKPVFNVPPPIPLHQGRKCHCCLATPKMSDGQAMRVTAMFNFKGTNNDELCFAEGDVVTVTQALDGGWWEGTLNSNTGWFPSNYVQEVTADIKPKDSSGSDQADDYKRESMQHYRNVVLKNVIETEDMHVLEMSNMLQNYLRPIQAKAVLSPTEFSTLIGNLEEIISFQQSFLNAIKDCETMPLMQRRVGGLFLRFAPRFKQLHMAYCSNHPRAVGVLLKHREELRQFVEKQQTGAMFVHNLNLTTCLSKPFVRLDRYPSLLKELERHIEENHPDRGDTQRAIVIYREIANSCMEIRKLREMETEILTSNIVGWEGNDIEQLGEVTHLSQIKLHTLTGERRERILVLFSHCLVLLSASPHLSGYRYEGKLPLAGMTFMRCEDVECYRNGFEISGPMIDRLVMMCGTRVELAAWLDALSKATESKVVAQSSVPAKSYSLQVSPSRPSLSRVERATAAPPSHAVTLPARLRCASAWSFTCLRPSPPIRSVLMCCRDDPLRSPRAGRRSTQRKKPVTYNEDAFILQVIEAYCNSSKARHTLHSSVITHSSCLPPADDKKMTSVEEVGEKSLTDTVCSLKDRVTYLDQEVKRLRHDVDVEKHARLHLECSLRHSSAACFPTSVATAATVDISSRDGPELT